MFKSTYFVIQTVKNYIAFSHYKILEFVAEKHYTTSAD